MSKDNTESNFKTSLSVDSKDSLHPGFGYNSGKNGFISIKNHFHNNRPIVSTKGV